MEYIKLKNSDLVVSRICMGGCPMGGYGWGCTQEEELIKTVQVAFDKGITFFDTADVYGLGNSEKILGNALGNRRKDVVIATKFGVRIVNGKTIYDNSCEYIQNALDASLKRLGTDYIDLYQVHYRDQTIPLENVIHSLNEEKRKGKIRYYGLSNIHKEDMKEIEPFVGSFVSFQDEYSLACRKNENDIRKITDELQMNPLTWGSLGQGILTGKYDKDVKFDSNDRRSRDVYVNFHGEKLKKNLQIVQIMKEIACTHHKPIEAVALRFILDFLPESVVLCGAKRPEQILGNIKGDGWNLTEEEIHYLDIISSN
ncbi:MAG: aldo/keto reductase [Dorea sp.]|nr:aldo/keto reductase [Dorea sp.]